MKHNNALNNRKKIDVVTKYFFPVTAGIEVTIMETYRRLVEMGWDVTIHTSTNTYLEKNVLSSIESLQGLKIRRYPLHWYGFLPNIDYFDSNVVALHNFNFVPHFYIMLQTLLLKVLGKKHFKLVFTPHGGFVPEWSTFSKMGVLIKKTYHFTIGTVLINLVADGIQAVSEWESKEISAHGVNKKLISVITNGVEEEAYLNVDKLSSKEIRSKVKSLGKYILQVGRINKIKNYETVINALVSLPKDIDYVIAGPVQDGDQYVEALNSLIKLRNLEGRVHFIGVVKGVDKYYLIKHAQLMVHMAIAESFCNVVQEGLSQGLVCVVSDSTALPYLVKDGINGYCVSSRDSVKVAEKINYVLKNKNSRLIKDMEKRNKKYGLVNSWNDVAHRVDNVYESLLNARSTRFSLAFKITQFL